MYFLALLMHEPGVTDVRPRQRLFAFCNRILRDNQHIFSTYLPLGTCVGRQNINGTENLRVVCPTFCEGRARVINVMGFEYRGQNPRLPGPTSRMVAVQ